jgi:hypothetical protein
VICWAGAATAIMIASHRVQLLAPVMIHLLKAPFSGSISGPAAKGKQILGILGEF